MSKQCLVVLAFLSNFLVVYANAQEHTNTMTSEHKQWLRDKFSKQHQEIIPKVAVADIFYGCNMERKTEPTHMPIEMLVNKLDKTVLAEKLTSCLGEETIQSDTALKFGLTSCYRDLLSDLPEQELVEKMELVNGAISKLSQEERKKSFTKCVTEQAIKYLK